MIAAPPLETGAVHDTVTCALPDTPATPVGGPGTVAGTTEADALEAAPVPVVFVAFTVNVYEVPFVRSVTVHEVVAVVQVKPPGEEVTV